MGSLLSCPNKTQLTINSNAYSTLIKEELQEHYVMVQAATKVCEGFKETAEQSERQVQSRKTWVEQQRTYNPSELIQLHSDQQEARRLQEAEKAERLNQRQERKRKREEDRLQRQLDRAMRTCRTEGCDRVYRGGKRWVKCNECQSVYFCESHKSGLIEHEHTHQ